MLNDLRAAWNSLNEKFRKFLLRFGFLFAALVILCIYFTEVFKFVFSWGPGFLAIILVALVAGALITKKWWYAAVPLGIAVVVCLLSYIHSSPRLPSEAGACTRTMQHIEMDGTPKPIPGGDECKLLHVATGGDITLSGPGNVKIVDRNGITPAPTSVFLTTAVGPPGSVLHAKACGLKDRIEGWNC